MRVEYLTTFSWIHLVKLAALILLTKKGERQEEAPPATLWRSPMPSGCI